MFFKTTTETKGLIFPQSYALSWYFLDNQTQKLCFLCIFADMKRIISCVITLFCMLATHAQFFDVQCEDTCSHVHGIDLSHYQGEVFWETVGENTKNTYVYLKATEGGDRIDPTYQTNIELAHRYGLKVGSYHFFRPKTDLTLQLQNFMTQCRPGDQDLIPMIDVETRSGLSTEAFCDSLHKFLGMVEDVYSQKPLIYTGANFYDHNLQGQLDSYQIMIAQYTDREPVLADGRDITMWQYTGKGRINGINTFVDKSRMMGRHGLREIRFRRNAMSTRKSTSKH